MIDLNKLNADEKEKLKELRDRFEGDIPKELEQDGSLYYRFLKARDFDLDRAEKMLRKHLVWRKIYQVDSSVKEFEFKECYVKHVKTSAIGLNKNGDHVQYAALGKIDARDFLKCCTRNEFERHTIWESEEIKGILKRHSQQEKQLYCQLHGIVDLDELTLANVTYKETPELLKNVLSSIQDNYPEHMKCVDVINAPNYYVILWSILKIFMSSAMLQKFRIYGHSGWKEKLLERIDATVLPAFLGGTRTDPDGDPLCRTFVSQGGKISSKLYVASEERDFGDRCYVQRMTVPPSSVREVHVSVREERAVIEWEILIRSRNIDFGLFYGSVEETSEILPLHRISTPDGVERNCYRAQLAGNYVFVFDNRYSWLNKKDIEYCFTVKREN